jgi:hypothetical protein
MHLDPNISFDIPLMSDRCQHCNQAPRRRATPILILAADIPQDMAGRLLIR